MSALRSQWAKLHYIVTMVHYEMLGHKIEMFTYETTNEEENINGVLPKVKKLKSTTRMYVY